ncbi:MAG: stage II sporulation protein R [Oscillospiraceae bacterium]|nr:stage II sporulation protein R [Oscillospiraceae bacterium]
MKTFIADLLKKHALSIAMLAGAIASVAIAGFGSFAADCERIPDEVLRLHIIANSDSKEDQQFKYKLRDRILQNFTPILGECGTLESAKRTSESLLPEIEKLSREFAAENNYNTEITAEITEMYFTTRVYDNLTLPAGNYTALRITIGEGNGKNWWCVMFPLLCVPAVADNSEVETTDAINVRNASTEDGNEAANDAPKVKFAVFEFLSGFFK